MDTLGHRLLPCLQANHDNLDWIYTPTTVPTLDPKGNYILSPQGFTALGPTVTPPALGKFLGAMTGKQYNNPPGDMLASRGLAIYDLLELFTGKPMPGRVSIHLIANAYCDAWLLACDAVVIADSCFHHIGSQLAGPCVSMLPALAIPSTQLLLELHLLLLLQQLSFFMLSLFKRTMH